MRRFEHNPTVEHLALETYLSLRRDKMSSQPVCSLADQYISTPTTDFASTELSEDLRRILPPGWGTLEDVQIQVINNHRGKRCTVEMSLQTTTGLHRLIGKFYDKDRADVYQTMDELRQLGFGPQSDFSIPEPLAYLPAFQLLLYQKVEGARVDKILLLDDQQIRASAVDRCARWLTRFQTTITKPKRVFELTNYLRLMELWSCRIIEAGEPIASKAAQLFKEVIAASSGLRGDELCASHGGFRTRNVIFVDERTCVIDWDTCELSNPCRDVGSFLADLSRLALVRLGSIRALDAEAQLFQRSYRMLSNSKWLRDLPFYKAAKCLELAHIDSQKQHADWGANVAALLDEGFRALRLR